MALSLVILWVIAVVILWGDLEPLILAETKSNGQKERFEKAKDQRRHRDVDCACPHGLSGWTISFFGLCMVKTQIDNVQIRPTPNKTIAKWIIYETQNTNVLYFC